MKGQQRSRSGVFPLCVYLHTGFSEIQKSIERKRRRERSNFSSPNIGLHSGGCMKELPGPAGARPTPSFMEIDTEALIFGP